MGTIKLNKETMQALQDLEEAFRKKFGRDPGPSDPIFFNPDADEPRFFSEKEIKVMQLQICEAMRRARIDPGDHLCVQEDWSHSHQGKHSVCNPCRLEGMEWCYRRIPFHLKAAKRK